MTAVLAGMCHCRGLDQGRDLAAGLPGRPVVIFQPRNLPELFLVLCRIHSASPEQEEAGWAHGGLGLRPPDKMSVPM